MLAAFGAKIWGYIAAGGAFLLAMLLFWNKAKRAGKKEVKDAVNAETTETVIKTVKKVKKIDKKIDTTPTDDLRASLRDDWTDNSHSD